MLHYLKLMLQILMSPKRGWDDVAADETSPRYLLRQGLLPVAIVASLTVGLGFLYQIRPQAYTIILTGVVAFVRYMLTYFIAVALLVYLLPRVTNDGAVDRTRVELFSVYCVGMMALIGILENIIPYQKGNTPLLPLIQFLPLYVVVVMIQGRGILNIIENRLFIFAAITIIGIILPIFLIDGMLLPS